MATYKDVLFGFLLVVGFVVLAGNVKAEVNLIPDGGFEKQGAGGVGIPDLGETMRAVHPWVRYPGSPWEITNTDAHSGDYSLKYNGGGEFVKTECLNAATEQAWITLKPNTDYVLTFWEKGEGSMRTLHLQLWDKDPPVNLTGVSFWQNESFPAMVYLNTLYTTPVLSGEPSWERDWGKSFLQGQGSKGTGTWVEVKVHFRTPAEWNWGTYYNLAMLYLAMAGDSKHPAYFDDFEIVEKNTPPAVKTEDSQTKEIE